MNRYGYCIFEDQSGDVVDTEQGYSSVLDAKTDAVLSASHWTLTHPRGCYSWDVYDVVLNETVEVSG